VIRDADVGKLLFENAKVEISKRNWIFCRYEVEPPEAITVLDDFEKAIGEIHETIHTDYEWLKYHTRLQVKALEWERTKDNSRLLRGKELREAEEQLTKDWKDPQPTAQQRQLALTSRRYEDKQRRRITIGLGVGFIAIAVLAIFAWIQNNAAVASEATAVAESNARATALENERIAQATAQSEKIRANEQTLLALSRQLANSSITVPSTDLDLKLLLSAQAINFADTAEARSSLFGDLLSEPYLEGILGWEGGLDYQAGFDLSQFLDSHARFGDRGWFSVDKTYAEEKFPYISTNPFESTWGYYSSPLISGDESTVAYEVCKNMPAGGAEQPCEIMIAVWKSEPTLVSYGESVDMVCNFDYKSRIANLEINSQGEGKFSLIDNNGNVLGEFLSSEIRIATQQYNLLSVISFDVDNSNNYLVTAIAYGRHYFAINIILWNLTTGQEIGTLYRGYGNGSPEEIDGLIRFSNNSDKVYFCEKTYQGYNENFSVLIDPVQLRDFACSIAGRNLTSEEWDQYVGSNIPYEKTCSHFPEGGYPSWSNNP
jgi:hypothetical protein